LLLPFGGVSPSPPFKLGKKPSFNVNIIKLNLRQMVEPQTSDSNFLSDEQRQQTKLISIDDKTKSLIAME
jgi:hypothetical protein